MNITFLGHAGFYLVGSSRVLIDPFLTGNPLAKHKPEDLQPDLILLSHGHGDHMGDAESIARNSGALVVGVHEMACYLGARGIKTHGMHIGGSRSFDGVTVKLTPAWHGSSVPGRDGESLYLGTPAGFIVQMDGKTVYHAGDTGLFGDMALLGRRYTIDVALLPIGDNYTMGPDDALEAVNLLRPRLVIPMHYNTFPLIEQDAHAFAARVTGQTGVAVQVLVPGASVEI